METMEATALPTAEKLAQEILSARLQSLRSKIRPQESKEYMYLSDIHKCIRHNYYSMVDGDKRKPFDEFAQARMESGNIWEKQIVMQLIDMGFELIEGQVRVEVKYKDKLIARGKIDGKIRYGGKCIPVEIKNLDSTVWRRINCVEDLFATEWTEKYVRQLLMYMYGNNEEQGLFIITDRGGLWKILPLYLGNYLDYAERTLRSMERAFEAKLSGTVPDRMGYHHKICGGCQFATVCLPDMKIEGSEAINDPEIEAMIARHEELGPAVKEHEELHDSIAAQFIGKPETIVGSRFSVKPLKRVRVSYDTKSLDDKTRKEIETQTEFWVIKIFDLTKPLTEKQ